MSDIIQTKICAEYRDMLPMELFHRNMLQIANPTNN